MKFCVRDYKKACREYRSDWKARDDALRGLCKKFPNHQRRNGVNAKLWIISRSYATGIERRIKSAGTQGSSMERLADHFWRRRTLIDKIIKELRSLKEPLTTRKLKKIANAHGKLLQVVRKVLKRKRQSPRSFVSKYLHFHNPVVPIFDSVVVKGMRKLYPHQRTDRAIQASRVQDRDYREFLGRFWKLYNDVRQSGQMPTVRFLDYYLLYSEDKK
jgi:hypothetical protein